MSQMSQMSQMFYRQNVNDNKYHLHSAQSIVELSYWSSDLYKVLSQSRFERAAI